MLDVAYLWENEEQAKAGNELIVVTEEVVPTEYIPEHDPERTMSPGIALRR